ncbi:XrtY-associated glycosyltransferase XYAG1 [Fibrella aquatica]|uniref:XrtY-associated glycosyltransferase XYAG1 n=1 Tax=Fibrella aquatica TaxID=3242487 RepID=UPI003521367C
MKILHVVPSYKPAYIYGGPIESVASLCEALISSNNEVSVFTTTANGDVELDVRVGEPLLVDGVSVTYFNRITKGNTHVSPSLWLSLFKECDKYDVIHIHSWWNPLVVISAAICHMKKAKVVISPRGMLSQYIMTKTHGTLKKAIHKYIGRSALQKSLFHATAEGEYIECQNLIQDWQGFLLPNLIKLPELTPPRSGNEIFTLVFLSRIHPKKGLELLFEAISLLKISIRLRIAGSGEESYIQDLKKIASSLHIDSSIEWLGWMDKTQKFVELANADLFVLTSFNENFANVVIESLYVGTPVLLSENIGLAGFVNKTDLGWVSELNVNSIVKTLETAVLDVAKRDLINKTGKSKITECFSEKIIATAYLEEYSRFVGINN